LGQVFSRISNDHTFGFDSRNHLNWRLLHRLHYFIKHHPFFYSFFFHYLTDTRDSPNLRQSVQQGRTWFEFHIYLLTTYLEFVGKYLRIQSSPSQQLHLNKSQEFILDL